ncbi:TPA: SpaA isopeptide-forming pilin-related protein [Streptococcus agalactiae]
MSKKHIFICLFFMLFLVGCQNNKKVKTDKKVDITAYYYHNNTPQYSVQINAIHLQTALDKVRTGEFESKDFTHYTFDSIKRKYQVSGKKVLMDNNYRFGSGIKNTRQDAIAIVRLLLEKNKDYLIYMNGLEEPSVLYNPENKRYKFTNNKGKAIGNIPVGLTAFENSAETQEYVLKNIQKNETIYLGNTRVDNPRVTVNNKKRDTIGVEYGKRITYRIPIYSKQLTVRVSPNFVVDSTNYNYRLSQEPIIAEEGKEGRLYPIDSSISVDGDKIILNSSGDETEQKELLQNSLYKLHSIDKLDFDLTNADIKELEITGHVASKRDYNLSVAQEKKGVIETKRSLISVDNQKQDQGIFVEDSKGYIKTPSLSSYGINFAMYDDNQNRLLQGSEYILGRLNADKKVSLYQPNGFWINTQKTIKSLNKEYLNQNAYHIRGNNIIGIDGYSNDIDLNPRLWAYNYKKQVKSNQSLFKLRGLSNKYKYFLIQTKSPKGYLQSNKPFYFTVNKDSVSKAQFGNYNINGYIMDMQYNKQEYNALANTPKGQKTKKTFKPMTLVILFAVALFIFYITAIRFVFKRM